MRGFLLSTTAPLSVMLALAPSGAAAHIDVTAGGYAVFRAGLFDMEHTTTAGRDFVHDAVVTFDAQGVSRSGLVYGASVRLNAATNNKMMADEAYLFGETGLGRIELGDNDGASDRLSVYAPTVGIGQINGKYVDFIPYSLRPSGNIKDTGGGIFKPLDCDDATKIVVFSPRIEGFQAGVSFAPEGDSFSDGEHVQISHNTGRQHNFVEAGLQYLDKIETMRLRAAFTATHAEAKSGAGHEDVTAWAFGAQATYNGLTFGGNFVNNGDSNQPYGVAGDKETAWTIGLSYRKNTWDLAVNLAHEDYQQAGGRYNKGGDYSALVFGGSHKIARGLSAGLDLAYFARERADGFGDSGSVIVFETKAVF